MNRREVVLGLSAAAAAPALANPADRRARAVPKGFLWGTAISAHQSEGNNTNSDMWVNEHVAGTLFREPSGDACDSLNRWNEDLAIADGLGFNCHRFGIEWARIEPEPGQFSLAALDHYRRVLEGCHARGLRPMVTFSHFSTPRWFAAQGGFETPGAPDRFAAFCGRAAKHFGTLLSSATTFNEINAPRLIPVLAGGIAYDRAFPLIDRMLAASARACGSDRFSSWPFTRAERIEEPTREAHARAYAAIKAEGRCEVGISLSMQELQAERGAEARVAELNRLLYDQWLARELPADFIGVQTYTRVRIGVDGNGNGLPVPDGAEKTDAGYEYYPPALGATVRYAARVGRRPVIVTESGIATSDDSRRIAFIDATLGELGRCLDDGIDLRGYLHWSLLDNYEWTRGYAQHFGLVAVDRATFKRTPKPSALHLGRTARTGRL